MPFLGGDEWGRDTVVFHIPPFGFMCIAYRTCRCEDCDEIRTQTAEWERAEREQGPWCLRDFCSERTKNPGGYCDEHDRCR